MMAPEDTQIDLMTLSKEQLVRLVVFHKNALDHLNKMNAAFVQEMLADKIKDKDKDIAVFVHSCDNLMAALDDRLQQTISGTLPKFN